MRSARLFGIGLLLISTWVSWAQMPVFEVASVKESKNSMGSSVGMDKGRYRARDMPLQFLIAGAYGVRSNLISGLPGWAESARYSIDAKVDDAEAATMEKMSFKERGEEQNRMLRALLEERFHLQAKLVEKELPDYELVIAKGGLKMKESVPNSDGSAKMPLGRFRLQVMSGKMIGQGIPFSSITPNLEGQLDRQVIDKTGLTGKYDFTLQWTPDSAATPDSPWPDFFTAVQEQLGLKLMPSKGMQKTLVVDHLERPTEN